MNEKSIVIVGNGGHATVLTDMLLSENKSILGYASPTRDKNKFGLTYLGNDESILKNYSKEDIAIVNGIGSVESLDLRSTIYKTYKNHGYDFLSIIHKSAFVSQYAQIEEGAQIMAGCVIQAFTKIGENTIINSSSSIDHDCDIGGNCHLAPGVTVCGGVTIGEKTHIGPGAAIIQRVNIGSGVLIGAGSLIIKEIENNSKVFGVPAKDV